MLLRINPTTFPFFVLDDAIILPKHKYENLKLPEMRKPENKKKGGGETMYNLNLYIHTVISFLPVFCM